MVPLRLASVVGVKPSRTKCFCGQTCALFKDHRRSFFRAFPVEKVVETGNLWIESPAAHSYSTSLMKSTNLYIYMKIDSLIAPWPRLTPCSTAVTIEPSSKHLHRSQHQMLRKSIPTKTFFRLTR